MLVVGLLSSNAGQLHKQGTLVLRIFGCARRIRQDATIATTTQTTISGHSTRRGKAPKGAQDFG